MYSTILFLDRPRHLRYDIQAILDLDQLLLKGFMSVFSMEADFDALKLLFWAGLKHEDPYLKISGEGGIGEILSNAIAGLWTYETLMQKFTEQIINDQWILTKAEKSETPVTIRQYIGKMEELNYQYLHWSPKDFYSITPREFNLAIQLSSEKENHDLGLLCATVANSSGSKKQGGGSWQISDFVPVKRGGPERQTAKQMNDILTAAFGG